MVNTVLCYIKKDNCYLMLYRNKKKNDPNAGKWMGVGGHIENGETPDEAMIREIKEETGLVVKSYKFKGIATFCNNHFDDNYKEKMYLYVVECFDGELINCNEGELKYFTEEEVYRLNMWEGDKSFLPYIFGDEDYFEIVLYYEHDKYIKTEKIR